jgi:putative phosphoesterase
MTAEEPVGDARVVARVGLISDTHGYLDQRAEWVFANAGLSAIVHAGDVQGASILYDLEAIAPLTAVAGNMDVEPVPGWDLPGVARTTVEGVRIAVVHKLQRALVEAGADVVVYGHTHRARVEREGATLVVNPGSATHPRSGASPSVGILEITRDREVSVRIVMLDDVVA